MGKAYYGSKISKNMVRTPEDFLVCKNVPIARTGVQKYLGKEIGILDRPDEIFKVYRTEEEVFSPKTMASFEGKAFTEEHPENWVGPTNAQVYLKGAVTNVRRGEGQDSDLLLADIIVYSEQQIREIESRGKREVSCGYECDYQEHKDGFKQTNIIGNHVALVSAGRAGSRVAIRDNKSNQTNERSKSNMTENGYKLPRRQKAKDFLYGIGLKHFAMDADPEDMAEAVDELVSEKLEEEKVKTPVTTEEVDPAVEDEDPKEDALLAEIYSLKDTIESLLNGTQDEDVDEMEDEDFEEPDGLEALDELEEELDTEDDEAEEIESVEVDPEVINESDSAEEVRATDSIKELASVLKQVVANIPDARERKKTSDALAKVLRKHADQAKKGGSEKIYGDMLSRTKDSKEEIVDIGMEIAKKFNPHYKSK